jgi:hypothetical protein
MRWRIRSAVACAALAVALGGCAVEGQSFERIPVASTKSTIYVYRPYHFLGSALSPMVTCGHDSIEIGAGGYHAFVEDPGTIVCTTSTEVGSGVQFEAHPEEEYYVRETVEPGIVLGRVHFTPLSKPRGLEEIQGCCEQQ